MKLNISCHEELFTIWSMYGLKEENGPLGMSVRVSEIDAHSCFFSLPLWH